MALWMRGETQKIDPRQYRSSKEKGGKVTLCRLSVKT